MLTTRLQSWPEACETSFVNGLVYFLFVHASDILYEHFIESMSVESHASLKRKLFDRTIRPR